MEELVGFLRRACFVLLSLLGCTGSSPGPLVSGAGVVASEPCCLVCEDSLEPGPTLWLGSRSLYETRR